MNFIVDNGDLANSNHLEHPVPKIKQNKTKQYSEFKTHNARVIALSYEISKEKAMSGSAFKFLLCIVTSELCT